VVAKLGKIISQCDFFYNKFAGPAVNLPVSEIAVASARLVIRSSYFIEALKITIHIGLKIDQVA
jgi:hypothetical protein